MKTLQECKDQIVREDGWNDYRHFCSVQPAEQIIVLGDKAAELYARICWKEACELTGNRIWNTLKHKTHPDPVNGDSVQMQHISRAVSGDKPEFKP